MRRRPRPTRRSPPVTFAAGVALTLVLGAVLAGLLGPSASAQIGPSRPVQDPTPAVWSISSVTPWVEPDGEFQVRFDPSTTVPADASLTVTIHQSVDVDDDSSLRRRVEEIIEGDDPGPLLRAPITTPIAELGDPTAGAALTIPVRANSGDAERVLLPNPGIHPVELVLTRDGGPELWSQVVFLNRLPEADEGADRTDGTDTTDGPDTTESADTTESTDTVRVTLVLPVLSDVAVGTDGTGTFTVEDQTQLTSVAALLEAVPDAPVSLGVRPNTLDGLARTTRPWAEDLLETLANDDGGSVVMQMPYVEVDTGALVASDRSAEIDRQVVVGAGTVAEQLGRPTTAHTWALDGQVSTPSLPVLAGTGVQSLIVPIDALQLPSGVDEEQITSRPMALEGGAGIGALAYDTVVSQRLADATVEPGVRAHQSVALLMAGWFAEQGAVEPDALASAVLVAPSVDPAVLESLAATLGGDGPLVADPSAAPVRPAAGDTVSLVPTQQPDLRGVVDAADESRRSISAYRSMVGAADPSTDLWDELTNESVAAELDAADRADLHAVVRTGIDAQVARIEVPRERRVVVARTDATIPLRFRNDLPWNVTLEMRARSPRLDIDEPVSTIVLAPGENVIDLAATVQAPGESLLRIDLSSPDGGISIPGPDVPVRSNTISGVGAALSIVSVLFLVGWWVRTLRRNRRQDARDAGQHPSTEAPAEPSRADRLVGGG